MPEYAAHVLVCANTDGPEDTRHCGGKGGAENRKRFNELLVQHDLLDKVTISSVGCTSQHGRCDVSQGSMIIYGSEPTPGGTWYVAQPDDVEEIITEHLINGRIVERLQNKERSVKLG